MDRNDLDLSTIFIFFLETDLSTIDGTVIIFFFFFFFWLQFGS